MQPSLGHLHHDALLLHGGPHRRGRDHGAEPGRGVLERSPKEEEEDRGGAAGDSFQPKRYPSIKVSKLRDLIL